MSRKLILVVFVFTVLCFSSASYADKNQVLPKSFASYDELQTFFHYNAHFDNEDLIKASQAIHFDPQEFCGVRTDDLSQIIQEPSKYDLDLSYNQPLATSSAWQRACCWSSTPCEDGFITLNGLRYAAKQISDTILAYNVTPYVNIQLICSVANGQTTTITKTITTTDTMTISANFSLAWDIFEKLKLGFGFSASHTTTVATTVTYSSTYTFSPKCNGFTSQNYYAASTCDRHLIRYVVAPSFDTWTMRFYDCTRATEVEMLVDVPHQQTFYVCMQ